VLLAALGILIEVVAPLLLALALTRGQPRRLKGLAWGAGLFLAASAVKQLLLAAGVERLWGHGSQGWPLIRQAAGVGMFVSVVEETVRFSIGRVPLREDRSSLFSAAAPFGTGWGGLECLLIAVHYGVALFSSQGPVPLPLLSLLAAAERLSGLTLQVALSGLAAQSARRPSLPLFGLAVWIHAVADGVVRALSVPIRRSLEAGDFAETLKGECLLQAVFGLIAFGSLAAVGLLSRVKRRREAPVG